MRASPYTLLYIIADNDLVPIMRSLPTVRWFVLMTRYLLRYLKHGLGVGFPKLYNSIQRMKQMTTPMLLLFPWIKLRPPTFRILRLQHENGVK